MDVWQKLEAHAYRNPEPYPQEPFKPRLNVKGTSDEMRAYADALDVHDELMKVYRELLVAYNVRSVALEAEFRRDLEAHYDMVGHPKADLLYGKAYQMGHSGGMQEVANYYSDLVELVR